MTEPVSILMLSIASLLGITIVSIAALAGWRGWLDLQRLALASDGSRSEHAGAPPAAARIEIADLKERIRKLEAIAAGIDL